MINLLSNDCTWYRGFMNFHARACDSKQTRSMFLNKPLFILESLVQKEAHASPAFHCHLSIFGFLLSLKFECGAKARQRMCQGRSPVSRVKNISSKHFGWGWPCLKLQNLEVLCTNTNLRSPSTIHKHRLNLQNNFCMQTQRDKLSCLYGWQSPLFLTQNLGPDA